ncbi:DUF2637 domain-containing protein [Streptomyces aureocirculatus]|uniref:DUF2637 domain-containing protein n=1 Tax=Streptomyces aureocirculatus TaxID=67275 RepID=UPI00068EA44F|nr:DUF2637 domain-containing protein [Streptomyces aureocirculatus]
MRETRGRHSRPQPDTPVSPFIGGQTATDRFLPPLDQMDVHWDPTEELAHLLHTASKNKNDDGPPAAEDNRQQATDTGDGSLAGLVEITAELPLVRPPSRRRRRRRRRTRACSRARTASRARVASFCLAALATLVVSVVCVFGGIVSYNSLRRLATHHTAGTAVGWWPLLVYGPWTAASLSILRAALHQRRAAHSWAVVLLFSILTLLLSVAQAPHTAADAAAAAVPSLAALACFQQFVRQVTLTRPPRQSTPRHRKRPPGGWT